MQLLLEIRLIFSMAILELENHSKTAIRPDIYNSIWYNHI